MSLHKIRCCNFIKLCGPYGPLSLVAHLEVVFHHEARSANGMVDSLAKQGVDRGVPWEVLL